MNPARRTTTCATSIRLTPADRALLAALQTATHGSEIGTIRLGLVALAKLLGVRVPGGNG